MRIAVVGGRLAGLAGAALLARRAVDIWDQMPTPAVPLIALLTAAAR